MGSGAEGAVSSGDCVVRYTLTLRYHLDLKLAAFRRTTRQCDGEGLIPTMLPWFSLRSRARLQFKATLGVVWCAAAENTTM
jgi:hypothetical protein